MIRRILLTGGACLAASQLFALPLLPAPQQAPSGDKLIPWTADPVDFRGADLGDVNGDLLADLLQIVADGPQTRAVLLSGVGYHEHFIELGTGATAGTLTGLADQQQVVLATSQGYDVVSMDSDPEQFTTTSYADSNLAGSRKLLYGNGILFGINDVSAPDQLVVCLDPFGASSSLVFGSWSDHRDIALLDWDPASPGLELAAATASAVRIFAQDGTLLDTISLASGTAILVPFRQSTEGFDRLAIVYTDPGGTGRLLVAEDDSSGGLPVLEGPSTLASNNVYAAGVGRMRDSGGTGADAEPDLVLLSTDGFAAGILENGHGQGPTFTTTSFRQLLVNAPSGASLQSGELVIGDVEGDGDDDLVLGLEYVPGGAGQESATGVYLNASTDAAAGTYALDLSPDPYGCTFAWSYSYGGGTPTVGLPGSLTLRPEFRSLYDSWDGVEWAARRTPFAGIGAPEVVEDFSYEVVHGGVVELTGLEWRDPLTLQLESADFWINKTTDPPLGGGVEKFYAGHVADYWIIQFRLVDTDPQTGEVVQASSPSFYNFTLDSSVAAEVTGTPADPIPAECLDQPWIFVQGGNPGGGPVDGVRTDGGGVGTGPGGLPPSKPGP